ncbi:baseplate J/gp47 family protein [Paenibacillus melissococcoides]|uniref:baseplate J/gp47 family protein n=1 Tax=Paenibacillus melissococcoides TaxID=2912268 RepID=UPI0021C3B468|nr:baseplate J/gp47 family protein [Paenibacillus melissococcoides]
MLDASGFKRMRYSDLLEQMEEQARAKYGETTNTSALSPLGIILRIFAFFLAYVWQGVEHVYYAAYRDTATGVSLDRLAPQVGIKRFQEEFAYGELTFIGTPEYTIPEGTIVGTATGKYFVTNEDLTLDNDGKGSVGGAPRSGNRMERCNWHNCGFAQSRCEYPLCHESEANNRRTGARDG